MWERTRPALEKAADDFEGVEQPAKDEINEAVYQSVLLGWSELDPGVVSRLKIKMEEPNGRRDGMYKFFVHFYTDDDNEQPSFDEKFIAVLTKKNVFSLIPLEYAEMMASMM